MRLSCAAKRNEYVSNKHIVTNSETEARLLVYRIIAIILLIVTTVMGLNGMVGDSEFAKKILFMIFLITIMIVAITLVLEGKKT